MLANVVVSPGTQAVTIEDASPVEVELRLSGRLKEPPPGGLFE